SSLSHIHVQSSRNALAHSVGADVRFEITRVGTEQLLLNWTRLHPVLEADQAGVGIDQSVAWSVDECDCLGLQLVDRELSHRNSLRNLEFLCLDFPGQARNERRKAHQHGDRATATHTEGFQRYACWPGRPRSQMRSSDVCNHRAFQKEAPICPSWAALL